MMPALDSFSGICLAHRVPQYGSRFSKFSGGPLPAPFLVAEKKEQTATD
jgi:hypothetical protein